MYKTLGAIALLGLLSACGSDLPADERGEQLDTSTFTTLRSGSLVAQDEPATRGTVHIRSDDEGQRYLVLADDFQTAFHTGSVAFFLAKTTANLASQRAAEPDSVSERIGRTTEVGGQVFAIPETLDDAAFETVVVYCEPVGVNFGAAVLR